MAAKGGGVRGLAAMFENQATSNNNASSPTTGPGAGNNNLGFTRGRSFNSGKEDSTIGRETSVGSTTSNTSGLAKVKASFVAVRRDGTVGIMAPSASTASATVSPDSTAPTSAVVSPVATSVSKPEETAVAPMGALNKKAEPVKESEITSPRNETMSPIAPPTATISTPTRKTVDPIKTNTPLKATPTPQLNIEKLASPAKASGRPKSTSPTKAATPKSASPTKAALSKATPNDSTPKQGPRSPTKTSTPLTTPAQKVAPVKTGSAARNGTPVKPLKSPIKSTLKGTPSPIKETTPVANGSASTPAKSLRSKASAPQLRPKASTPKLNSKASQPRLAAARGAANKSVEKPKATAAAPSAKAAPATILKPRLAATVPKAKAPAAAPAPAPKTTAASARLPSAATSHTASSAAKDNSPKRTMATSTLNHTRQPVPARTLHKQASMSTLQVRKPRSSLPTNGSGLGRSSSRASSIGSVKLNEGFLERMSRPTMSSSLKTHGKLEIRSVPPRSREVSTSSAGARRRATSISKTDESQRVPSREPSVPEEQEEDDAGVASASAYTLSPLAAADKGPAPFASSPIRPSGIDPVSPIGDDLD